MAATETYAHLKRSNSSESVAGSGRHVSRFVKGTSIEKPPNNDGDGLLAMLMHPLCVLLIFCPLGIVAWWLEWSGQLIFFLNFLGLIPLAKILGDATEELAAALHNDMLAGMLNATFGNAVEVVIMVQTLRAGLMDVVKATLLGSVLSNLLLVLGCSFFFGGLVSSGKGKGWKATNLQRAEPTRTRQCSMESSAEVMRVSQGAASPREDSAAPNDDPGDPLSEGLYGFGVTEKVQTFSVMTAMVNVSLLLLSCLCFCLVTVFFAEFPGDQDDIDATTIAVSRHCAVAMMLAYVAYVFFQLVTHRESFSEEGGDDEEAEEASISIPTALSVMLVVTIIVAFASELLVESLDEVVQQMGISRHFIGIILLPIVGNACEHAAAVRFAIQDKPGLSIGIAVGSSTQISLFVVPLSVLMGWWLDLPMDLNFGSLNTTVLCISVLVVLSIVVDGSATWLQGYLLISAYYVVSVLYWHLPDHVKEME